MFLHVSVILFTGEDPSMHLGQGVCIPVYTWVWGGVCGQGYVCKQGCMWAGVWMGVDREGVDSEGVHPLAPP